MQFCCSRLVFTIMCLAVFSPALDMGMPVCTAAEFAWSSPLGDSAAATAEEALIVVLVTNDVSAELAPSKNRRAPRSTIWCERSFRRSAAKIPAGYLDPSAPIQFQHWAIGLPPIVTGGTDAGDIGRAIVFVTDGHYRILAMSVGVPEGDDLTHLIEDAEDTRSLLRRHRTDPNELIRQLADRTRDRLNRIWQIQLDQQLTTLGEGGSDPIRDVHDETERYTASIKLQIGSIAGELQSIYLKDAQMRFGLTDATDLNRLDILEQHAATRAPWVTLMQPFLVGGDLRLLYTDVAEIVWDRWVMPIETPGEHAASAKALADWISQIGTGLPFAFRMSLPLMIERADSQRLGAGEIKRPRSVVGWQDLEDAISAGPTRQVTVSELAAWLAQANGKPLDLQRPSRARVLFFRSAKDSPYPIREGSPPGRAITMIRQVQK